MNKLNGFALVLDYGDGVYQMSKVHKTADCAMRNGLGPPPFGLLNDIRIVALVPVSFEDDGVKNLHLCLGDAELAEKEIAKYS